MPLCAGRTGALRVDHSSNPLAPLLLASESAVAIFVLIRRPTGNISMKLGDWLLAITATAALSVGLGMNGAFGAAGTSLAVQVGVALVGAFAGMALGQRLRQALSAELFRRAVLSGLAVLGAVMIARSVW